MELELEPESPRFYMWHLFTLLQENIEKDANETLKLEVDGKVYTVHRILYITLSDFFRTFIEDEHFSEAENEIKSIRSVTASTFDTINEAVYGAPLQINEENLLDLLYACDFLQFSFFQEIIEEYILLNLEKFDSMLLSLSRCHSLSQYKKAFSALLTRFSTKFYEYPMAELLELSLETLGFLLSSTELRIHSTTELHNMKNFFEQWILHDSTQNRALLLCDVVNVLFPGVSVAQDLKTTIKNLLNNRNRTDVETLNVVTSGLWSHVLEVAELRRIPDYNLGAKLYCFKGSAAGDGIYEFDGTSFRRSTITLPESISNNEYLIAEGLFDGNIYVSTFEDHTSSLFKYNPVVKEWLLLDSSSSRILDLVACDNKIITYRRTNDRKAQNQFCVFEKHINRRFELPPILKEYDTDGMYAGVTSDAIGLYSIVTRTCDHFLKYPSVEFYDFRASKWMCKENFRRPCSGKKWFSDISVRKQVGVVDTKLYCFQQNETSMFDLRNCLWTSWATSYSADDDNAYVIKWKNNFHHFKSNHCISNLKCNPEGDEIHHNFETTFKPFNMY